MKGNIISALPEVLKQKQSLAEPMGTDHGPHLAPIEEGNEATFEGHVGNEELRHPQQGVGERSWEHRFKSLQHELSRVKEVVRGRAPDSMDIVTTRTK